MKKRILSLLLLIALSLTVVVVCSPNANAASQSLNAAQGTLNITGDTELDLNGYDITTLNVASGATVTLKDSQTDDYNASNSRGYGEISAITGAGTVKAADGYLMVNVDDTVSVHKLTMTISAVALRAEEIETNGASVYYQCTFGGDEVIKEQVETFGLALGAGRKPNFAKNTFTREDGTSQWVVGSTFTGNSVLLKGILREDSSVFSNKSNAKTKIFCCGYIELKDGSRVTYDCVNYSLRDIIEGSAEFDGVEQRWNLLEETEKTAAGTLYGAFERILQDWIVPQVRQAYTGGAYQLYHPEELYLLGKYPSADFILMKNVDMADVAWTPVNEFSGKFDGNDKVISNVLVDPDSGTCIGMFSKIAESGEIVDLNLENITVDASGTGSRFVGTIAGQNVGRIENCTATGTIKHDREATQASNVFLGALVGKAEIDSVTIGGTSLSVVDKVKDVNGKTVTYTTTGLCAKVKMDVPDGTYMCRRLVGNYPRKVENGVTTIQCTMTGDWQDLSFSTEDDSAVVQSRRREAVRAMAEMGTFKWTVPNLNGTSTDPDLIHYGTTASNKETHVHTQKFYSGTTYYGIPYDHTSSSYEQAMHYLNKGSNGVYVLNNEAASAGNSTWGVNQTNAFNQSEYIGFTKYIGNDCSGAVAWAWHHAAPRWVGGGGVYVLLSTQMMPNDAAEETYGIYRVGPYTVTDDMTAEVDGADVITSPAVAKANGSGTMYESYARTQMGDGLMYGEPGGHARLVAADSVVIRNPQGSIYGAKSYMLTHEQGDGLYDRATTNSSWRINYKYTFYELYNGTARVNGKVTSSGSGYLPITIKAYHDDTILVQSTLPYEYTNSTSTEKITTPALGQVNAGNRILCVKVTMKDSSGNVVYNKTAYKGINGVFKEYRSQDYLTLQMKYYFSDYVDYVTSGKTYTFSVDCTVAGGTLNEDGTISNTTVNVVNNRSFTAQ